MWQDITQLCKDSATELNYQMPMINIDDFSLHDAMSAVEVMNVNIFVRILCIVYSISYVTLSYSVLLMLSLLLMMMSIMATLFWLPLRRRTFKKLYHLILFRFTS